MVTPCVYLNYREAEVHVYRHAQHFAHGDWFKEICIHELFILLAVYLVAACPIRYIIYLNIDKANILLKVIGSNKFAYIIFQGMFDTIINFTPSKFGIIYVFWKTNRVKGTLKWKINLDKCSWHIREQFCEICLNASNLELCCGWQTTKLFPFRLFTGFRPGKERGSFRHQ